MRTTRTTQLEPRLAPGAAESTKNDKSGVGWTRPSCFASPPRQSKSLSRLAPGLSRRYWPPRASNAPVTPGTILAAIRRRARTNEPNGLGGPS